MASRKHLSMVAMRSMRNVALADTPVDDNTGDDTRAVATSAERAELIEETEKVLLRFIEGALLWNRSTESSSKLPPLIIIMPLSCAR
jgi:hypothetical protein